MSGGWTPIHHADADEPAQAPASEPRESKPAATIPLTLVMSIPPELIAALSSLAGTMERIASEVAAQGRAIQELAEAISTERLTAPRSNIPAG